MNLDPTVAVVVPTRHEAQSVRRLHESLTSALAGMSWFVLFVDDSDDETPEVLAALSAQDPRVSYVHREGDARIGGLGGAVLHGLRLAADRGAAVLVVMDADLQHPTEAVPRLVQTMTGRHADIVVASRYREGGSSQGLNGAFRHLVSRGCRAATAVYLRRARTVTDPLSGFFAVRPEVLRSITFRPDGYKILLEILVRGRWNRVEEISYEFQPRLTGRSKSGVAEGRRFLRHLRMLRSATPGRDDSGATAARALRILILTSEAPPVISGIARSVAMLSTGLRARGHEVAVVSRADFPNLSRNEIRLSGFGLAWPRFRRTLSQYDVVNVHGPVPMMSETFLWLLRGLSEVERPAVVYTHHSDLAIPGLEQACEIYNRATRRLAHVADEIVVTSEHYRDKLGIIGGAPTEVIPWAVSPGSDGTARTAPAPGTLRALFVGQLRPYKGLSELLTAASRAPEVSFTIVGDGPLREELAARVRDEELTNVRLVGRVSDAELWARYEANDVVVLPSTTTAEAFGLVLIEGMAAGCVPIASDLPGVREVAGPTGVLIPPGDAESLTAALRGLADDHGRLADLAAASRAQSALRSTDEMVERYDTVLSRAAHVTARRHGLLATPAAWPDPASFLHDVEEALGTTGAQLELRDPATGTARVWRSGNVAELMVTPSTHAAGRSRWPLPLGERPRGGLVEATTADEIVVPLHTTGGRTAVLTARGATGGDTTFGPQHLARTVDLLTSRQVVIPGSISEVDGRASGSTGRNLRLVGDGHSTRGTDRPLHLVVDGRVLVDRYHGIGRVLYEQLLAWRNRDDVRITLLVGPESSPRFSLPALRSPMLTIRRTYVPLFGATHLWRLERELREVDADVALFPYHLAAPLTGRTPRVAMVHDCTFELDPTSYPSAWSRPAYRAVTSLVMRTAHVVTVSEASASDIRRVYGETARPVAVVYNGVDPRFGQDADPRVCDELGLPKRYVLTVGARRPHKNLGVAIRALTHLPEDVHLVCVGAVDPRVDDGLDGLAGQLGVTSRVHHLENVAHGTLAALYGGAVALLFPSRHEGFGLPLLEAMASRTPVLAGDIPVSREIAGDAALYVQPDDPRQWAAAVVRLLEDPSVHADLVARGTQRVAAFSWERSADELLAACRHASRAPA
jgi:glycosyltransferase involved in cell wall biosynthesis